MATSTFVTTGGLTVEVEEHPLELDEALTPIFGAIDSRKGAIFSSGFDYPGRHSRWDIGFIDPAIEFISQARRFEVRALNPQGSALLPLISNALRAEGSIESLHTSDQAISGELNAPPKFFPEEKRSRQASVFSVLRAIMQLLRSDHPLASNLGFYGAFGYDLVQQFEEIELHHTRSNEIRDCHLFLPLSLSVVDRKREVAMRYDYSITTPTGPTRKFDGGGKTFAIPAPSGSSEVTCDHAPGEFAAKVQRIIEGTKRGDYFEVVLSQTFSTRFESTPTALFKRLALINPSPYMFLINMGEEQLVGASPELYARVTGDRYETCPIAGTIPRGATALEDAAQVQELMSSRKDESELTMCTDVDRNDMARVCKPGSVRVIGRRQLEFYSHLIHTVDHLEGYLAEGFDALDAFQTHMWACTVTGAPKPAALQEIERLENSPRGWYSGAVGFLSCSGSLNTGITLRTATLRDGRASVRAGATLLFESATIKIASSITSRPICASLVLTSPRFVPDSPMKCSTHSIRISSCSHRDQALPRSLAFPISRESLSHADCRSSASVSGTRDSANISAPPSPNCRSPNTESRRSSNTTARHFLPGSPNSLRPVAITASTLRSKRFQIASRLSHPPSGATSTDGWRLSRWQ